MPRKGTSFSQALRHVRSVRPAQALPDLHTRGRSPVHGKIVVLTSLESDSPAQLGEARLVETVTQGPLGMGSRAHGIEVQVQDPGDGLLGVVVLLAQLRVVGLNAAQPSHDRGPHVLVGLLVGDEVNGSVAGRAPRRLRAA